MSVITWTKQGGRRYPQFSSPSLSTIGIVWTSKGKASVPAVTGLPASRLMRRVGK